MSDVECRNAVIRCSAIIIIVTYFSRDDVGIVPKPPTVMKKLFLIYNL